MNESDFSVYQPENDTKSSKCLSVESTLCDRGTVSFIIATT